MKISTSEGFSLSAISEAFLFTLIRFEVKLLDSPMWKKTMDAPVIRKMVNCKYLIFTNTFLHIFNSVNKRIVG